MTKSGGMEGQVWWTKGQYGFGPLWTGVPEDRRRAQSVAHGDGGVPALHGPHPGEEPELMDHAHHFAATGSPNVRVSGPGSVTGHLLSLCIGPDGKALTRAPGMVPQVIWTGPRWQCGPCHLTREGQGHWARVPRHSHHLEATQTPVTTGLARGRMAWPDRRQAAMERNTGRAPSYMLQAQRSWWQGSVKTVPPTMQHGAGAVHPVCAGGPGRGGFYVDDL